MERIGRTLHIPATIYHVVGDCLSSVAPGVDIVQPLLAVGGVDVAISTLTAFQMLGKPEDANVLTVAYGALFVLEVKLMLSRFVVLSTSLTQKTSPLQNLVTSSEAGPVVSKLRSAGTGVFRYCLDNNLVLLTGFMDTATYATKVAALVWGKDEGGGLTFTQSDVDKVVQNGDLRGPFYEMLGFPMMPDHGRAILHLTVSDANKNLLLNVDGLLRVLVDALLLDPEHPQRAHPTFEANSVPVQRDFTEALQQLAVFPAGREALLAEPSAAEALQHVAEHGWSEEAQECAQGALSALSDREALSDVDADHFLSHHRVVFDLSN